MPLEILRSPAAEADLFDIWAFIAEDSVSAADRHLRRLMEVLHTLAAAPAMGRERGELAPGLRSFPVGNYALYYRIEGNSLILVRALNAARQAEPDLFID
ncbi:type II toxin-antitoxin system RelE/ParE family toxin [Arsenicitalea aurantiaca]|uniref:Type II toxin-antitoxin system RelE/ParE family toxin n=1 Tax=Arsenicitalea aurantiaca TaxID=1783274 RepID=A0A433XK29_9HYPH|nr:type II toxin-antitoxin system RelE/ParE family toxin [Arsenicitalea aurantiaca]RUT34441.1 type II toxin-antitoxin system RelE/ParE family toxin [Arsenicitalea aurantiaca]